MSECSSQESLIEIIPRMSGLATFCDFNGLSSHPRVPGLQRRPGGFASQVRMGLIAVKESLIRVRGGWRRPPTQRKRQFWGVKPLYHPGE